MANLPLSWILVGQNTLITRLPRDSLRYLCLWLSAHWPLPLLDPIIPIMTREPSSIVCIFHCPPWPVKDSQELLKGAGAPLTKAYFSGPPGRDGLGWLGRLHFVDPFQHFQFPELSGFVLCNSDVQAIPQTT